MPRHPCRDVGVNAVVHAEISNQAVGRSQVLAHLLFGGRHGVRDAGRADLVGRQYGSHGMVLSCATGCGCGAWWAGCTSRLSIKTQRSKTTRTRHGHTHRRLCHPPEPVTHAAPAASHGLRYIFEYITKTGPSGQPACLAGVTYSLEAGLVNQRGRARRSYPVIARGVGSASG